MAEAGSATELGPCISGDARNCQEQSMMPAYFLWASPSFSAPAPKHKQGDEFASNSANANCGLKMEMS